MATVYLVRHGQASSNLLNYDSLSDLGQQQILHLAKFYRPSWKAAALHSGTLTRQRQSEQLFSGHMVEASTSNADARWNEFDFLDIVRQHRPEWEDPVKMQQDLSREDHPGRAFLSVFRGALERWIDGGTHEHYTESWTDFNARTAAALAELDAEKTHWVFTSGGVISALISQALKLDAAAAMRINLGLHNASVTTLRPQRGQWRMQGINQVQHFMDQPDWLTFH
ncbi:histidine phosphatase family protein [Saccharospirillum impatiens]|uniref:histidine phosphatase family protein n=1 Tax=Saccharospirillum impatiens TaxID=169438 RepID=UPI0004164096|nr:histidine phosphatase family protein [Saccharospirillum impatiens]